MSPLLIDSCIDTSELAWAIEVALGVVTINKNRDYPSDMNGLQKRLESVITIGEFNAIAMLLNTHWSDLEARLKQRLALS